MGGGRAGDGLFLFPGVTAKYGHGTSSPTVPSVTWVAVHSKREGVFFFSLFFFVRPPKCSFWRYVPGMHGRFAGPGKETG